MLHQHQHAETGTTTVGRSQAEVIPFERARRRRPVRPFDIEGLLPRMRAVGITTAVAKISGEGRESHVDSVDVYPSSEIRIKAPMDQAAHMPVPEGAITRDGTTQIMAADAVKEVVKEMIDGIWWAGGHHGEFWIEVSDGTTRLEMHRDRD